MPLPVVGKLIKKVSVKKFVAGDQASRPAPKKTTKKAATKKITKK